MSTKWLGMFLLSGAISLIATQCFAEQHSKTPRDAYHAKLEAQSAPKRTPRSVLPSKKLTHIFDNIYHTPEAALKTRDYDQWKHTKEKLRSLASVHFNDSIQIGLDRVKTGPSKYMKSEIVEVNPHLAPKSTGTSSRGIGLQMRVKLD